MKKKILIVLAVLVAGLVVFLFLPSNYYIRRALTHFNPTIDQYPIFENRIVHANDPHPWEFAPEAGANKISPEFEAGFEEYKTVAFVVVQNNQILLEQYWEDYGPISLSNSFSMAKSILSLLVGCAITDGYIESVDQPVSDFLPEWTSYEGQTLTIKHLLTMSTGVEWDESYSSLFSKTTQAYYGNDLWKLTLTQKFEEKPGVRFNYQSGVSQMIAFLLEKATGKRVADYASEKIWTPVQAEEDALWSLDKKDGMEKAYCCFNSNARDFARLGQLVLNHGKWNGKQVVDSAYVSDAVSPATWLQFIPRVVPADSVAPSPQPCTIYGYQFWIVNYKGLQIPNYRGMLGQYIFIIPELNAVIVRLGHQRDTAYNIEQNYPLDIELWLDAGLKALVYKDNG